MTEVLPWVAIAGLGAIGALARFTVDASVSARWPSDFPFGTLAVNLSGAFVLGLLVGLGVGGEALRILSFGLLGSYTTFSTWMFEAERLAEDGEWRLMWLNLAFPLVSGFAVAGLGWLAGAGIA